MPQCVLQVRIVVRFYQVVHGMDAVCGHGMFLAGGDKDYLALGIILRNFAGKLDPVHTFHVDVKEYQIIGGMLHGV